MVIGKTSTNVSVTELFEKYSEVEVLTAVFPEIKRIPCKISSPFRSDSNPSFGIYMDDNKHIRFKDFGDSSCKGTLLDLLCMKWNCSFRQVFGKILEVMQEQNDSDVTIKPKQIKTLTRREVNELTKIQVAVRPWKQYDYDYWNSYGISKQWLKYAEVYPISHKIITKKDAGGKEQKYIFSADKYAYVFVERKENKLQLKIYQPYNKKYKWCSCMDSSVISLWTKVPEKGDRIVICSSLKDSLCLSANLHIPAISPQGEGYNLSDTAVSELKRRYKKIFICYDTDKAGIEDGKKLSQQTGFIQIVPDLGTEKDLSDYYKSLENKEDFKQLEKLFI